MSLDLDPRPFRPTGPGAWLLSFREARDAMRPGLDIWGYHLVRHAAASWWTDTGIVQAALRELVSLGVLIQVRYMPHMPEPALLPTSAIWHNTEHAGPMWKWVYRVATDWRERLDLPPSSYWRIRHRGVVYSGEGAVPAYLQQGEVLQ